MNKILFHLESPEFLPVGIEYKHISNIEQYDNNSLDNIIIQDILDFYDESESIKILRLIFDKLTIDGKCSIQSVDLHKLALNITSNQITEELVNSLLYPNKKQVKSLRSLEKILKNIGYTILVKKYINIFEYYIVVTKI